MRYVLLAFLFLSLASPAFPDDDHDSDEILLQLAPGVSINTINARYGTRTEDVLIQGTVYRVRVQDEDRLDQTVAAMQKDPDIVAVEFNYFGETPEAVRRTLAVVDTSPVQSRFKDQDAYKRIRTPQAQSLSTGAGVIVAVIDTGVDYRHPELATHVLRDSKNRVIGYDFIQKDRDPMDSANGIDDDGDGLVDEGAGHGTHVAGIIRLVAPAAKILPLRVLNSDGVGTADAVARAIEWAVEYAEERKAPMVINLSLGFPTRSFVVEDAIEEAVKEGIPVVASAGNDHGVPHYPAAYKQVISVAAVGPNGVKAGFSNFGSTVDLSAPGVGIYSTYLKGRYAWWSGTSMSAPFVSGEAALVMSMLRVKPSDDDPKVTNLLPLLAKGVDYIYEVNPAYRPGRKLGYGSIDLYSTLAQIRGADRLSVQKAVYSGADRTLTIIARSSRAPASRLTVPGLGTMKYDSPSRTYRLIRKLNAARSSITVTSSAGGVITAYVATSGPFHK